MYYVYISDDDYKYEIISVSGTMGVNKAHGASTIPSYYLVVTIDYNGERISLMDRPFDLSGMKFYEDDTLVPFEHISRNLLIK
jgi:hypothetical protein